MSELVALTWAQVHLDTRLLDVRRVKNGKPSTHDLLPDEIKLLKVLRREGSGRGPVFVSERGLQISDSSVKKLVARLGVAAGLPFPVHAHQLRHACGYYLVNEGMPLPLLQRWLGHVNVQPRSLRGAVAARVQRWRAEWKRAASQVSHAARATGGALFAQLRSTRWRQLPLRVSILSGWQSCKSCRIRLSSTSSSSVKTSYASIP